MVCVSRSRFFSIRFSIMYRVADTCCRVARAQRCMSEQLVTVSALCALEAAPLRFNYFATFWRDVAATPVTIFCLRYDSKDQI